MNEIVVNDVFDELRDENLRLESELNFAKDLITILENIKNCSLILKNNCICSENIEMFKKLNDFEIDYKILKSKQNAIKTETKRNVYQKLTENGFTHEMSPNTSGIEISNVKSIKKRIITESSSSNQIVDQICNECNQSFDTELDLLLHVNRHHKCVESFVCHECKQVFDSRDVFSSHLLEHQSNQELNQSVSISESKPRTKTDCLRNYRKPNSPESVPIKRENKMRLITEMFKPSGSSKKMSQSSDVMSIKSEAKPYPHSLDQIQCNECQNTFETSDAIESHIKDSHPCLVCSKCQQWFHSKQEVFTHLSTFHKIKGKYYCCDICNYKTSEASNFQRHKRTRVCSKGSLKCINSGCEATFNHSSLLKRHRQICLRRAKSKSSESLKNCVQTQQLMFSCGLCPYKTKFRFSLARHLKMHSTPSADDRPFKCDINFCNMSYKRKCHLNDHKRRVHKDVYQLNIVRELNQNIRKVSKFEYKDAFNDNSNESKANEEKSDNSSVEQQIKVEFISDSDNESLIKDSMERPEFVSDTNQPKTDGNYCCKYCDYKSNVKRYLVLHEYQDHPQLRPFKCDFPKCGRAYTREDHLGRHKRQSHRSSIGRSKTETRDDCSTAVKVLKDGKLFECDVCHYKTELLPLLRRHMTSHSPDKPFKCGVDGCEYRTKRKDVLRKHQQTVHKMNASKFVCNYPNCKRILDSQLMLRQHMGSHKNRFLCRWEGCQYRTDTFAKLNEHRRAESHMPSKLL